MSEKLDSSEVESEVIEVRFGDRPHPVADFEDASAYVDHKNNSIMWAWEFTRRTHWYQTISDWILVADDCRHEDALPDDLKSVISDFFDCLGYGTHTEGGKRIVDDAALVHSMLLQILKSTDRGCGFGANWRKAGYWQNPEGPPDDLHVPHIRSHQSPSGPWAIKWPGMRAALRLVRHDSPSDPVQIDYGKAVSRGVTVGGGDSLSSKKRYERIRRDDSDVSQRMAYFAFDLSLPIEFQLKAVRSQLAFMQEKALESGLVERVKKATSLPGKNGVLMLRCLDASVDDRRPNDSQVMRAFGWDPPSDRTRFKRLRERAIAFRDEQAPKLCEFRG